MRFRLLKKNVLLLVVLVLLVGGACVLLLSLTPAATPLSPAFQYGSAPLMRKSVYDSNFRQVVLNAEVFPQEPALVLVVQAHARPGHLRLLLESLGRVEGVRDVLLVVSHDHVTPELLELVRAVRFCRVLQIFFPYSTQLYPDQFPGSDPRDCPRDATRQEAELSGCLNAQHPDAYGHYREAAVTQAKHHWWWKLHFVFERVRALRGYGGWVVLLEEDNYLLPDLLHYVRGVAALRDTRCSDCDLLAIGNHRGFSDFPEASARAETSSWVSAEHNMGVAVSRELYYRLMGCSKAFCTYDDYNWDWSLQSLSASCLPRPLKVLTGRGSRVMHTGQCGMHQGGGDCGPEAARVKVEAALEQARAGLFPSALSLTDNGPAQPRPHVRNGGWGDVRDHTLCINYAARL